MRRLLLIVVSLFALIWTGPALAHSTLARSEPAAGAKLKESPNEVRIWFTEPIKAGLSTIEVLDPAGKQIDRRDLRVDEKDHALVHLSLPTPLDPGVFRVTWTAVAQDLHVTRGSFTFQIAP